MSKILLLFLILSVLASGQEIRVRSEEYRDYIREKLQTMEGSSAVERIETFEKILLYFSRVGHLTKLPEDQYELRQQVREFVTAVPGHALEMRRRIHEIQAMEQGKISGKFPEQQGLWASQILNQLWSPEAVGVMADLLAEMHGPDFDSGGRLLTDFGRGAANGLSMMLENPPQSYHDPKVKEFWLQWKKEVEEGTRTFRIKGIPGSFNFDGPVPASSGRQSLASRTNLGIPTGSGTPAGSEDAGSDSATPSSHSIWIYLLPILAILFGIFLILKQRLSRKP